MSDEQPSEPDEKPIERTPTEARQGVVSGRVVSVLAVSLGLVIIMFGLALMMVAGR